MKRLAAKGGFDVEFVRVVTNSAWIEYQWAHLVTFPRQGHASPFWGSEKLSLPQRMALKMFRLIGYTGVNHLIARLADAFGVGDRKSTPSELQSLMRISYAVFCLKKKNKTPRH